MDGHVRNRRGPPLQVRGNDNASVNNLLDPNLTSTPMSLAPMNLGGTASPPAFKNTTLPPPIPSYASSPRLSASEAFGTSSYPSPVVQPMPMQGPTLNIFGHSECLDNAPKHQVIQDYLDGGVLPASTEGHGSTINSGTFMNMAGYAETSPQVNRYDASSLPSHYSTQSSNASWQQPRANENIYAGGVPTGFGSSHVGEQLPGTYSNGGGFFGLPGAFAQQIKQIGEFCISNQQMEEDLIDPPLLEELGIDVDDIMRHIKCVLLFKSCQNGELQYADFTGPVLILLALALSLLISCNLNFSLVYIIEVLGTWFMYLLLNLTSQDVYIDMTKTAIILGYSLLPICLTPLIWIFARFMKPLAVILIYLCVGWSTSTASRLLTQELNMASRKYMIIYPTLLYYLFFAQVAMTPS